MKLYSRQVRKNKQRMASALRSRMHFGVRNLCEVLESRLLLSGLAPTSVAGDSILDLAATETGGTNLTPPNVEILQPASSGTAATVQNVLASTSQAGTYTYGHSGSSATLTIVIASNTYVDSLTFTTANSGTYSLALGSDIQTGAFVLYAAPMPYLAPTSLTNDHVAFHITTGVGDASSGAYRAEIGTDGDYAILPVSGATTADSGVLTYTQTVDSVPGLASVAFQDNSGDTGTIYLAFTSTNGGYYYDTDPSGDFQTGTFVEGGSSLAANGDFESGSASWNLSSGVTVPSDPTNAHSGSYVAEITTNGGFLWQALTGLTPNTTYQLTAYAMSSSKTTGTLLMRVDHDGTSSANTASFIPGSTYTQTNVTFTTGASTTTANIVLANIGDGTAYFDDLNLVASPIANTDFESGSSSWNISSGASVANDPANAHSAYNVAEITTNGGFLWQALTGLQANTTYQLSAYVKDASKTTGSVLVRVDHDGTSSSNTASFIPGTTYTQTNVTFTTGASTTTANVVLANIGDGTAYIDDLSLVATPLANPGFESGLASWNASTGASLANGTNAHSGNQYAYITTNGGFLWQALTGLTPDTTYQLTAYVKTSSKTTGTALVRVDHDGTSSSNSASFIPGSTYTKTLVTFTTGASTTTANVTLANIGDGSALFDDLSLVASPLGDSGFESGAANWNLSSGASVVTNQSNAYAGTGVAQVNTNGGFLWEPMTSLLPNTTYQLTAYIKDASKTTGTVLVRVDHDGISDSNPANTIPGTSYSRTAVTFTTGASTTTANIVLANIGDGTAYFDTLNLVATPVVNGNFETGSTSWNLSSGTTIANDPTKALNSTYDAEVTTNGGFLWQGLSNLQANTTYLLTVWAKTSGTTGSLQVRVDHDGTSSTNASGWNPGNAYGQTSILFTTGASTTTATIVLANFGDGTAYFDDVTLTALS